MLQSIYSMKESINWPNLVLIEILKISTWAFYIPLKNIKCKLFQNNRQLIPSFISSSYGYVSSTRVKFILIFEHSTSASLKDSDIKISFQRLHQAYIDCVSNPFYEPNTQLKSKRFEQAVTSLMSQTESMTSSVSLPPPALS